MSLDGYDLFSSECAREETFPQFLPSLFGEMDSSSLKMDKKVVLSWDFFRKLIHRCNDALEQLLSLTPLLWTIIKSHGAQNEETIDDPNLSNWIETHLDNCVHCFHYYSSLTSDEKKINPEDPTEICICIEHILNARLHPDTPDSELEKLRQNCTKLRKIFLHSPNEYEENIKVEDEEFEMNCFSEMCRAFEQFQNQWAGLRENLNLLQKSLATESQWNQLMTLIKLVDDTENVWISIMKKFSSQKMSSSSCDVQLLMAEPVLPDNIYMNPFPYEPEFGE